MNASQWQAHLRAALTSAYKHGRKRAMMLYGDTGIGKTEASEAAFAGIKCPHCGNHDVHVVTEHLSEVIPEDVRGVQVFDPQDKKCLWAGNPIWKADQECPVCYLLDEYNQAERPVRKAAMRFLTKFAMGVTPLPFGSIMAAIGNEAEHNADVDELFRPERTRLRHIQYEFSSEAWRDWALKKGIHPYVLSFLAAKESFLYKPQLDARYGECLPRSWYNVSCDLMDYPEESWDEVVQGEVGEGAAIEFMAWTRTAGTLMPLVDRVMSGEDVMAEELSAQFFIGSVLVDRFVKSKKLSERICSYALATADKSPESSAVMVKDSCRISDDHKSAMMRSQGWKAVVKRLSKYVA